MRARYGALMVECGYHFQVLGRAAAAGRWELASFEAKELTELFAEDLEAAPPPQDAVVEVLLSRNRGFLEGVLPPLVSALKARDPARFAEAHRATVEACNGCHAQAGYEFIEIAPEPGADFPRTQ